MRFLRKTVVMKISRLIFLLINLSLLGCASGSVGGSEPLDDCFNGTYFDAEKNVSIHVVHNGGVITATVWEELAADFPWEGIYFSGRIIRRGEARGEMTLHFPGLGGPRIPDVIISLPNDSPCSLRNSITLSLPSYTWEETTYDGENYNFTRQPP